MRVGPSFVPLTPFHHAKAAWQKGSATKARLVNKLELFLANVYVPRIEGSTFFPPPPSQLEVEVESCTKVAARRRSATSIGISLTNR